MWQFQYLQCRTDKNHKPIGADYIKRFILFYIILLLTIQGVGIVAATDTVTHYAQPSGYYYGESGTYTWIDYCPLCGCHDCLSWNPKGANPGEWTCMGCGADYDGTNGYDKDGDGARAQLERYYEPEPTISKMETVQPTPMTPLELAHHVFMNNSIL